MVTKDHLSWRREIIHTHHPCYSINPGPEWIHYIANFQKISQGINNIVIFVKNSTTFARYMIIHLGVFRMRCKFKKWVHCWYVYYCILITSYYITVKMKSKSKLLSLEYKPAPRSREICVLWRSVRIPQYKNILWENSSYIDLAMWSVSLLIAICFALTLSLPSLACSRLHEKNRLIYWDLRLIYVHRGSRADLYSHRCELGGGKQRSIRVIYRWNKKQLSVIRIKKVFS